MANSDMEHEYEFRKQLIEEYNSKKVNSVLMLKDEYYALMDELKRAAGVATKSRREYHILCR
jgi:hypothetical protein